MIRYATAPVSRIEIRKRALEFRQKLGYENVLRFPVTKVLEELYDIYDNYNFQIVEDHTLYSNVYADIDITTGYVRIKQSVYDRACRGVGRDRFTIGHELGHYEIQYVGGVRLCKAIRNFKVKTYEDPEWQADCFAGELLVPAHLVTDMSPAEIADECGVSMKAAMCQYNQLHKTMRRW